jgi:hypothetical protein
MELSQIIPLLFIGEIAVLLGLYRFVLREWIVDTWEKKLKQEGYLIEILDPVITEIENSTIETLEEFKSSFIGTLGTMTREAKKLDPMNNMRKAAANGDWTSMLLEYVTNKSGLSALDVPNIPQTSPKDVEKMSEFGKFK